MKVEEFREAVDGAKLPAGITKELEALWEDARGKWDRAHEIVQRMNTTDAMWVHAYLHREEGDLSNSRYWYSRISRTMPNASLEDEWQIIAKELLAKWKE